MCAAIGAVAMAIPCAIPSAAQREPLDALLGRSGAFAERFGHDLQGVVARERYVQTIRETRGRPAPGSTDGAIRETRRLLSSLLLVHDAETPWQLHRDVLAVDDRPLVDRADRLARLFADASVDSRQRLRQITDESARYNLGAIVRNINVPTFPLIVVHPTHRGRFRFRDRGTTVVGDEPMRLLAFEERQEPRLVRGTGGHEVVLKGVLGVDEASGELLRATFAPRMHRLEAHLEVTFGRVAGLPLRVPTRLVESYWRAGDDEYVAGEAIYDDFRRYTTEVGAPVPK